MTGDTDHPTVQRRQQVPPRGNSAPTASPKTMRNGRTIVKQSSSEERIQEALMLKKLLDTLENHEERRIQEGFNELNFAAGVLNCMLVAYIFGNYPEHFWLLWLIEAVGLVPRKIYQDWHAKPLRQILYYLDYCWVMNFLMIVALFVITMGASIPNEIRKNVFFTVVGVCCGPLLGATAALPFVAVVFHDNKLMTSLFIHLTPPMLVYTFLWHPDEILEAYPSFFQLDGVVDRVQFFPTSTGPFFLPGQGLGTVAGNAMALYYMWFVPYSIWMFGVGLDLTRTNRRKKDPVTGKPLPTSNYDTAYHSIVRYGICELIGTTFFGRPPETSQNHQSEGDYERRDLIVFMVTHAVGSWFTTVAIAWACCLDKRVHAVILWMLVIITVFRGANQYVDWVRSISSHGMKDEIAEILQEVRQLKS